MDVHVGLAGRYASASRAASAPASVLALSLGVPFMLASLLVASVLHAGPAAGAASPSDPVDAAWKARAERAVKKLSDPKLDACDRAVEEAFRDAKQQGSGGTKSYGLVIRVGARHMLVAFEYEGAKLIDFAMFNVPEKWMIHQPADSKTVSVVLGDGPRCAFDLCANDPFSDGPCAEKR